MKFHNKKALLFDLDGTLIDSVPDLTFAINDMLHSLKREPFRQETIRQWVGNGAQILVKRALSGGTQIDADLDERLFDEALALFLASYEQHLAKETRPYPNVLKTLQALNSMGYRLVIVTNKPEGFVSPILTALGMDDLFRFFLGGDSLEEKKPHPLPLLHACKKLKMTPAECIMIGDSKNDIIAANSAGMQSIGVTYGYNYEESITHYNPTVTADHFGDIVTLLGAADI